MPLKCCCWCWCCCCMLPGALPRRSAALAAAAAGLTRSAAATERQPGACCLAALPWVNCPTAWPGLKLLQRCFRCGGPGALRQHKLWQSCQGAVAGNKSRQCAKGKGRSGVSVSVLHQQRLVFCAEHCAQQKLLKWSECGVGCVFSFPPTSQAHLHFKHQCVPVCLGHWAWRRLKLSKQHHSRQRAIEPWVARRVGQHGRKLPPAPLPAAETTVEPLRY